MIRWLDRCARGLACNALALAGIGLAHLASAVIQLGAWIGDIDLEGE